MKSAADATKKMVEASKEQLKTAKEAMDAIKTTADSAKRNYERQAAEAEKLAHRQKKAELDLARMRKSASESNVKEIAEAEKAYAKLTKEVEKHSRVVQQAARDSIAKQQQLTKAAEQVLRAESNVEQAIRKSNAARKDAQNSTDALTRKIKSLVASYVSLQSVAKLVQLSDQYSNINAKLSMMEDRLEDTKAMQDAIMASAKRSRASYMDTANLITKLGTMASDAFDSFDELVAFSEQINKNLVLSGASASEASAATLQLSQALASGTLRGDELNSVMEQAPMIAERIADYLEIDKGKIRELASEGQITAEIVKNAMFATAEETNAAFESMPMTWAQVWTEISNTFIEYSQPILEAISWLAQNFELFIPVLAGVAASLTAYAIAQGIAAAATLATDIAAKGLWVTLAANPLAWIAVAIGLIIALIVKVIQWLGGFQVAWLKACNFASNAAYGVVDALRKAGELVTTIVGGVAVAVAHYVDFLINKAIEKINNLIDKANAILGLINAVAETSLHIEHLSNVEIGASADSAFSSMTNAFKDANETAERNHKRNESLRKFHIRKAEEEAKANTGTGGSGGTGSYEDLYGYLSQGLPSGTSLLGSGKGSKSGSGGSGGSSGGSKGGSGGSGSGTLGKIASDTAEIKKSVEMSNEEISMLVDMATQRYINNVNLEARAPVIQISGQNTGDSEADAKAIADKLRDILLEQVNSGSYLTYSII